MRECPTCSSCQDDAEERCPRDDAALVKTLVGARLVDGKYRLERRLSQGGMGVVYLARHVGLQREFAVKLIRSTGGWDAAQLARFRLEAETLGRLKHPGIVDVTDFGIDGRGGGLPYLVMEHLEGTTLMERCRSNGPLPMGEALPILAAVGRAIDFAHQHGVVHRDLKPANVFLCADGPGHAVKLLDFGLARRGGQPSPPSGHRSPISANAETLVQGYPLGVDLSNAPTLDAGHETASAPNPFPASTMTPPGSLAGTLLYMAPECFQGGESDPRHRHLRAGRDGVFHAGGQAPLRRIGLRGHGRAPAPRSAATLVDSPRSRPVAGRRAPGPAREADRTAPALGRSVRGAARGGGSERSGSGGGGGGKGHGAPPSPQRSPLS